MAGHITLGLTNTSGLVLDRFTLLFAGEQWRNGGNVTAQTMVLEYGFGNTFAAVTTWTAPGGSFNWTSPVATATGAAVDGNVAGLAIDNLTFSVTAVPELDTYALLLAGLGVVGLLALRRRG